MNAFHALISGGRREPGDEVVLDVHITCTLSPLLQVAAALQCELPCASIQVNTVVHPLRHKNGMLKIAQICDVRTSAHRR